jgi:hypothetical protein
MREPNPTVVEINGLMLEILRSAAAEPAGPEAVPAPRLVSGLRGSWQVLDELARRRLAEAPCVLLDAGFASPERWEALAIRAALHGAVMDPGAGGGYFRGPMGIALQRRALTFAWHMARSNRLGSRLLLGMSAECADRIAASALSELESLAELCPPWIAPRWESQPQVWRQMIDAAVHGSEAALRRVQLRGLQLLAATLP